jgi:hypothetical protein
MNSFGIKGSFNPLKEKDKTNVQCMTSNDWLNYQKILI